jgi:hypothetical protein
VSESPIRDRRQVDNGRSFDSACAYGRNILRQRYSQDHNGRVTLFAEVNLSDGVWMVDLSLTLSADEFPGADGASSRCARILAAT